MMNNFLMTQLGSGTAKMLSGKGKTVGNTSTDLTLTGLSFAEQFKMLLPNTSSNLTDTMASERVAHFKKFAAAMSEFTSNAATNKGEVGALLGEIDVKANNLLNNLSADGLSGLDRLSTLRNETVQGKDILDGLDQLSTLKNKTVQGKDVLSVLDRLSTLKSKSLQGKDILNALLSASSNHNGSPLDESVKSSLLQKMQNSTGFDFLSNLKQYLMASDQDLENTSIEDDGINTIELLLVKAGFKPEEVAGLIDTLKESAEGEDNDGINLSDFLDGLMALDSDAVTSDESEIEMNVLTLLTEPEESSDLQSGLSDETSINDASDDENEEDMSDGLILDSSFTPFLQSAFKTLGISEEITVSIIEDSEVSGEGIDTDRLIDRLASLQREAFFSGIRFETDSDHQSIQNVLNRIEERLSQAQDEQPLSSRMSTELTLNADFLNRLNSNSFGLSDLVTALKELKANASQGNSTASANASASSQISPTDGLSTDNKMNSVLENLLDLSSTQKDENGLAQLKNALLSSTKYKEESHNSNEIGQEVKPFAQVSTAKSTLKETLDALVQNIQNNESTEVSAEKIDALDENTLQSEKLQAELKGRFERSLTNLEENNDGGSLQKTTVLADTVENKGLSPEAGTKGTGENVSDDTMMRVINDVNPGDDNILLGDKKASASQDKSYAKDPEMSLSKVEKAEGNTSFDSGQSGSSFSGNSDMRGGQMSSTANERSTGSTLPSYVTNQVAKGISRAFNRGESEIRLQLKPTELGKIFMTIEPHGDSIKVSVVTENLAAKELLAGHANELKASLAANGVQVDRFEVEMGNDFSRSLADSGRQFDGSGSSGSGKGGSRKFRNASGNISEADDSIEPSSTVSENNELHFVA